jgi:hypothetical protein
MLVNPATMLQHNWHKLQDYFQTDQFSLFQKGNDTTMRRLSIMYIPEKEEKGAALNFHLSTREKRDIKRSFNNSLNSGSMQKIISLLKN